MTRTSSPPRSSFARRRSVSTVSPRRGALAPTAAASAGCAAPNRPSRSRVHKKRDFGGGDSPKSGSGGSSGFGASRTSAGAGGARLAAPRAGTDTSSHVAPPGAETRAQRKLTLVGRRSRTKPMRSRRDGSPTGNVAAKWRRRRALGPSPCMSRASSASKSSAPNKASMAGVAATIRAGGLTIAKRALSLRQSCGARSGSKAAAASSRDRSARSAGAIGGGWVKVGARL